MLKFIIRIIAVAVFTAVLSLSASALCEHSFECAPNKENLVYNNDMTHSYYCLKGCGCRGTVNGGLNGKEECTFSFASERKATCTEEGIRIYMCTVCYNRYEEKLSAEKHSYTKARILPTCTRMGYDCYTCSDCGDYYEDNFVQPVSHISDAGTIEIIPTCGKSGALKEACRVCGTVIGRKTLRELAEFEDYTPSAVEGFKVKEVSSSSVKLSWKKSEYALSYKVYFSTDKKKWRSVSADKTSVTVKKLKPSKKYYFKIKAVGDGVSSADSGMITAYTLPERVSFTDVVSVRKASATVKWNKLSNISGYELSFSRYEFGKKKNIKTVYINTSTRKTVKKLKSGKKYYFRVRAYKAVNGRKIYGPYSKTKTVKIR
ncbi:MAG: fibronectin type III domain-containing protein [Clostridia bacterium]|nr:fibronectin type III domain-containing protein [Clostridia bacterium]